MQVPLTLTDLSLLLAATTAILAITAELASPHYGHTNLLIDNKRLKNAAMATGLLFLTTAVILIYTTLTST